MLFQYTYPHNHSLELLNYYLLHFVEAIQTTDDGSDFIPEKYFHPEFVDILKNSSTMFQKFNAFFEAFKILPISSKKLFHKLLNEVQALESIFSDISIECKIYCTDEIENLIGNNTFKELSDFLFTCVKYPRWNIKGHYELIYNSLEHKVCPFCGIHPLHITFREDYDHLAPKSKYPLLSVNPKNLAPMCHDCNVNNKGDNDVLYTQEGNRRIFIYPYTNHIAVKLKFEDSIIPQTTIKDSDGLWKLVFNPDNECTDNWNNIFNIRKRYLYDFLMPNYETWLNNFVKDCVDHEVNLDNIEIIKEELHRYARIFNRTWYEQANIIKGPLFEFLANSNNELFFNSIRRTFHRYKTLVA